MDRCMARLPRYFVPEQPQHLIQRGNNREPIFAADEDYRFYLDCLQNAAEEYGLSIHAYVLMTNHVHLLVTPETETSIPKALQSVGRRYVQYFNYSYKRTGTLWEGRYKATLIDSESYLLICSRYIELNPVRAKGMKISHPRDYPWSSYRHNALGEDNALITTHALYQQLGGTVKGRQAAYRALFRAQVSEKATNEIREATNKGWALGNDHFRDKVQALSGRRVQPLPRGRPKKEND